MEEDKYRLEDANYSFCKMSLRKSLEDEFGSRGLSISHRSDAELLVINDFLNYLRSFLDYSDAFYTTILPRLEVHTLEKMTMLVAEGGVCTDGFWLQAGYGRYFTNKTDEEGLPYEVTADFCKPGKIMVVPECLFNGSTSNFNLQLARGAIVIPLPNKYFESLKLNAPEVEELGNKILALDNQDCLEKMKMLKMKPREKYREFLRIFGVEIEQCFAVKHVANYLGMRPSFLSRLRGENFKK